VFVDYFFVSILCVSSLNYSICFPGRPSLCFFITIVLFYCFSFYFVQLANKSAWLIKLAATRYVTNSSDGTSHSRPRYDL